MRFKFGFVIAVGIPLALAACNSSTKVVAPTTVPTPTSATSTTSSTLPASATVASGSSAYGSIVEANGRTLYSLSVDTATTSKCTTSACTTLWQPLTSAATFGSGVNKSLTGHIARQDGSQQITYGGHPLYLFEGDASPGQTNGEGINSFGGTWYVVSASTGQPVATASSPASTPTTTSSPYPSY